MGGDAPAISVQRVTLPAGGGAIKGLGETFSPNSFSGTSTGSVPLPLTKARALTPDLKLTYDSGSGNGPFGIGFSLSLSNITRRTDRGIPRYDDSDTFIVSDAGHVVPALVEEHGEWKRATTVAEHDGARYLVDRYRARTERAFSRIERWTETESGVAHWQVTTSENVLNVYGRSAACRVADPALESRIFRWNLEETRDAKGNRVRYVYRREDDAGVPDAINERNRGQPVNLYLDRVLYGNSASTDGEDRWAFQLVLDYGQYGSEDALVVPDGPQQAWPSRGDSFSTYRAGFEIRTHRLCFAVLLFHHFDELGPEPSLVRALRFDYDQTDHLSFLRSITEVGYRIEGTHVESKRGPPLAFRYAPFEPAGQSFTALTVDDRSLPGLSDGGNYQPVDLYGEGVTGILYSGRHALLYYAPLGEGRYAPPSSEPFPLPKDLHSGNFDLMDIDGDGALELVVRTKHDRGYYALDGDRRWNGYRSFPSWPADFDSEWKEVADLDGNGLADIVIDEGASHRLYSSRGRDGFHPGTRSTKPPGMPTARSGAEHELVRFADMFGDGLDHRVRITDGAVDCWPSLGRGRFGPPVAFADAPRFGADFDPARLRLADVDGSGTTDLIYIRSDHLEIFFNQAGNRFSTPLRIPLPERFDNLDQIYFADVFGAGTSCAVLVLEGPVRRHLVYDFNRGIKPHLLTETENNRGALTRIEYRSSTSFFLEDKRRGRSWLTKLPFPVQVVARTETTDQVSGSKLISRYAYHDGHYDGREREFRGFGLVERWDAEAFDQFQATETSDRPFELDDAGLRAAPVYTRSWFHTGADLGDAAVAERQREFYRGDPRAVSIATSTFEAAHGGAGDSDDMPLDAKRALHGSMLREEVYGADGSDLAAHPYTVTEQSTVIRQVQPKGSSDHAVYFSYPGEKLTSNYERSPDDPRLSHSVNLVIDEYGGALLSAEVAYPRRSSGAEPRLGQQRRGRVTCSRRQLINEVDSFHLLGAVAEESTFELGGMTPAGEIFERVELRSQVGAALADPIPSTAALSPNVAQARALTSKLTTYWDDSRQQALPFGEITPRALIHHVATAVLADASIESVFDRRVDGAVVRSLLASTAEDGMGRVLANGLWWDLGNTAHYDGPDGFYEQSKSVDPFGAEWRAFRDRYASAIERTVDPVGNEVVAATDYRTLQPRALIDANGTTTETLFDPLGRVRATTTYGIEDGRHQGDRPIDTYVARPEPIFRELLADPHAHLQGATSFFFDDLLAWRDRHQPVHAVRIDRIEHESTLSPGERSDIEVTLQFTDGFERSLQEKSLAEGGRAWHLDDDGNAAVIEVDERWRTSGRVVHNNKGDPVKKYEPFYSVSPQYVSERELTEHGVTPVLHYDPQRRLVRTDLPLGTFSKVEIGAWSVRHAGPNATIEDSTYFHESDVALPPDEQDALDKAREHQGTWREEIHDVLGRTVMTIERAHKDGPPLTTHSELDVEGRVTTTSDPRLGASGHTNFATTHTMTGTPIRETGADDGTRWTLANSDGDTVHVWDGRGRHAATFYDTLSRPERVEVDGDGLRRVAELMTYGDGPTAGAIDNARGRLVTHFDPAGRLDVDRYSFAGKALRSSRRLRVDYQAETDWGDGSGERLEDEAFVVEQRHDARGRVAEKTLPDGTIQRSSHLRSGLVARIELEHDGSTETYVERATYNARGQREEIVYGNGVRSRHEYDARTFLLQSIESVRSADRHVLQHLSYTHDAAGNITRVRDLLADPVFADNRVAGGVSDYTYDSLDRLIRATGREHPGLNASPSADGLFGSTTPSVDDRQAQRPYTRTYDYDAGGNLTRLHHAGTTSFVRLIDVDAASNRAVERTATDAADAAGVHDAHGNLTRMRHLRSIRWNDRDNIAEIVLVARRDGPPDSEHYVYDADGERIRKVTRRLGAGGQFRIDEKIYVDDYVLTRSRIEGRATTRERRSVHVMNGAVRIAIVHRTVVGGTADEPPDTVHFQLGNHLGSATLELTERGEIRTYEEYFPYGGTAFVAGRSEREVSDKEYRYAGRERDVNTGLDYYGARYYASWIGRWLSPDPAGDVDGPNLYAFVKSNPIRYTDDGGLMSHGYNRNDVEMTAPSVARTQSHSQHRSGRARSTRVRTARSRSGRDRVEGSSRILPMRPPIDGNRERSPAERAARSSLFVRFAIAVAIVAVTVTTVGAAAPFLVAGVGLLASGIKGAANARNQGGSMFTGFFKGMAKAALPLLGIASGAVIGGAVGGAIVIASAALAATVALLLAAATALAVGLLGAGNASMISTIRIGRSDAWTSFKEGVGKRIREFSGVSLGALVLGGIAIWVLGAAAAPVTIAASIALGGLTFGMYGAYRQKKRTSSATSPAQA